MNDVILHNLFMYGVPWGNMIRMIKGEVVENGASFVVVDVGGVWYLVRVPLPYSFAKSKDVMLHTYLAVRENALDLYGFKTHEELHMFELLIGIPKIGPKTALQIMSQADVALLQKSAVTEDANLLSKMSGIGKKSAEKIVLGLKDKFEGYVGDGDAGSAGAGESDIVDALITLGYSERDARETVRKIPQGLTDTNSRIKAALKLLSS